MRHKQLQLCTVLLFGLGLIGLQAQETVNTTAGDASGSGGSVSIPLDMLFTPPTQEQMVRYHREYSNFMKFWK